MRPFAEPRIVPIGRVRPAARRIAFVALSAVIVVVSSEKFFWYPQDFQPAGFIELTLFYGLALVVAFWAIDRYRVERPAAVLVAAALFALVVEGIVTPVLYEDGPFPFLAAYFFAWHGVLSFWCCWYLVRRWALAGQRGRLAAASGLYGIGWGLWSVTYWRSDSVAELEAGRAAGEHWVPGQWPVTRFALYAVAFTTLLVVAHRLLGHVWPDEWRPGRWWNRVTTTLLLLGLVVIAAAIPWAPVKLGVLAWMVGRRLRAAATVPGRSVFDQLHGHVTLLRLAPLGLLAVAAVGVYAAATHLDPSDAQVDALYLAMVAGQVVAGLVAFGVALRRTADPATSRRRRRTVDAGG